MNGMESMHGSEVSEPGSYQSSSIYSKYETILPLGLPWWLRQWRICLQCQRLGSKPGLVRSPGEGHGRPLQYSCLQNSVKRGAWWTTAMGSQRIWQNWATNTLTFFQPSFRSGSQKSLPFWFPWRIVFLSSTDNSSKGTPAGHNKYISDRAK